MSASRAAQSITFDRTETAAVAYAVATTPQIRPEDRNAALLVIGLTFGCTILAVYDLFLLATGL